MEECSYSDEEIQQIVNEYFDTIKSDDSQDSDEEEDIDIDFKERIVYDAEKKRHKESMNRWGAERQQDDENSQMVVSVGIVSKEKGLKDCRKIKMDVALEME